jgi:glucosamine--fructose-6-phosphate aminotransferase (isomerizing)
MKWLGKFPDSFLAEIAGQPDALRRAARALDEQLDTIEAVREAGRRAGGGVVFTGMGASYDACYPAVNELAVHGVLALQIDAAELLHFRTPVLSAATVLVIVSQSGRSAEVVRLLDTTEDRTERPVVLSATNGLANPLAVRADLRLDTRAGTEQGPSTMTFGASLVQLAAVACALSGRADVDPLERARTAAREASDAVEIVLEDETLAARIADVARGRTLVLLARGPARAAAEMGALTLKECGVAAESYETAAFRHGPLELAGPALGAIVVASEPRDARARPGARRRPRGRGRLGRGAVHGGRCTRWGARCADPYGGPTARVRRLHRADPAARVVARERGGTSPRRVHQGLEGDDP